MTKDDFYNMDLDSVVAELVADFGLKRLLSAIKDYALNEIGESAICAAEMPDEYNQRIAREVKEENTEIVKGLKAVIQTIVRHES